MRIGIATTQFMTEPEFYGGLSNFTANLATILKGHGHEVDVYVISNVTEDIIWHDEICVKRVAYSKEMGYFSWIPGKVFRRHIQTIWCLLGKSYVINRRIRQEHKKAPYDLIHFCDAGELFALSRGIPHVTRLSNSRCAWREALRCGEQAFNIKDALKDRELDDYTYHLFLRKEKNVIAPSCLIAHVAKIKYKRKVTVVESPFCVKVNEFDSELRKKYLEKKKYFLFYGSMNFLKGIHNIGQILSQIFDKYPDFYFVFLGHDTIVNWHGKEYQASGLLKHMAGLYSERAIVIPAVPYKAQVFDIVAHAEIIVLPSRVDNLPNTCIESMALGKTVIGTRGASFEQLITDGYNGWLAEIDNPDSLMKKIDQAMNMTEEERALFGKRAKKRLESMTPDSFYKNIMNVYKKTIKK